jgi:valyl-tRNA synthetase
VLLVVVETILKLMHPITPFVTEEIWSVLPGERSVLMLQPFPERQQDWVDQSAERDMALLMGVITGIRNIRAEANVHPSQKLDAFVCQCRCCCRETDHRLYAGHCRMTRLGSDHRPAGRKPADAATYIYNDIEIYVPLKGLVDIDGERDKLSRERAKAEADLQKVTAN